MAEPPETGKKVALFLPDMSGGGAERVVLAEARELVRRGHSVDLILSLGGGVLLGLLPPAVRVIDLGCARMSRALAPLVRYLRRERPDALHATMWPSTVIGVAAHRLARSQARLMVSDQVTLSQQVTRPAQRAALKLTSRLLYPLADVRVQCSSVAADDLARLAHLDRAQIEVITNPIEPPAVIAERPDIEEIWGVERGARLITVGALKAQKNHALLLDAFARLARPDARLMILGEGGLGNALQEKARALGVAERVIWPGFQLDPWPWLASADLFVLSSDYEGFPLVLAEAMAAGLRVVSTDCPSGPAELLDGGRFGSLVPSRDPAALAAAIDAALDEPVEGERQRMRAREMAGPGQIARYADLLTL